MKRFIAHVAACSIAVSLVGCASVMNGSDSAVTIASEPAGASFEVRDATGRMVHSGTTPNTVTLQNGAGYFKGAEYSVLVKKDGYAPQTTTIKPSISGWYFGNILLGGLIGMFAVDPVTGAMFKQPETSHTALAPSASQPVASK